MQDIGTRRRFLLILIKPSHYDDKCYVIQWMLSALPPHSLACLYGIAKEVAENTALGADVDVEIFALTDET